MKGDKTRKGGKGGGRGGGRRGNRLGGDKGSGRGNNGSEDGHHQEGDADNSLRDDDDNSGIEVREQWRMYGRGGVVATTYTEISFRVRFIRFSDRVGVCHPSLKDDIATTKKKGPPLNLWRSSPSLMCSGL